MKQINEVTGKAMQLALLNELYASYLYAYLGDIYNAEQRERLVASNFSEEVQEELYDELGYEKDEVLEAVVTAFLVANYRKVPGWQVTESVDENEIVSCFEPVANELLASSNWAKSLDMLLEQVRKEGAELDETMVDMQYVAKGEYVKVLAMSLSEVMSAMGNKLLVALGF